MAREIRINEVGGTVTLVWSHGYRAVFARTFGATGSRVVGDGVGRRSRRGGVGVVGDYVVQILNRVLVVGGLRMPSRRLRSMRPGMAVEESVDCEDDECDLREERPGRVDRKFS